MYPTFQLVFNVQTYKTKSKTTKNYLISIFCFKLYSHPLTIKKKVHFHFIRKCQSFFKKSLINHQYSVNSTIKKMLLAIFLKTFIFTFNFITTTSTLRSISDGEALNYEIELTDYVSNTLCETSTPAIKFYFTRDMKSTIGEVILKNLNSCKVSSIAVRR